MALDPRDTGFQFRFPQIYAHVAPCIFAAASTRRARLVAALCRRIDAVGPNLAPCFGKILSWLTISELPDVASVAADSPSSYCWSESGGDDCHWDDLAARRLIGCRAPVARCLARLYQAAIMSQQHVLVAMAEQHCRASRILVERIMRARK